MFTVQQLARLGLVKAMGSDIRLTERGWEMLYKLSEISGHPMRAADRYTRTRGRPELEELQQRLL